MTTGKIFEHGKYYKGKLNGIAFEGEYVDNGFLPPYFIHPSGLITRIQLFSIIQYAEHDPNPPGITSTNEIDLEKENQ